MKKPLRPMLGQLRRAFSEEARRQVLDVGKATVRVVREDVREFGEHLRDVKAGK